MNDICHALSAWQVEGIGILSTLRGFRAVVVFEP
jgi:hypothetical protein